LNSKQKSLGQLAIRVAVSEVKYTIFPKLPTTSPEYKSQNFRLPAPTP